MSFQLAHLRSQSVPLIKTHPVADDEAFFKGALLTLVNGEWVEADDYDIAAIDGIALSRYGVDGTTPYEGTPSFDILGGFGFPPGFVPALIIDQGNRLQFYDAEYVGTLPTEVGGEYGVVRDVDNRWKVDFDNTDDAIVRLESLEWAQTPLNKGRVVVSFVAPTA